MSMLKTIREKKIFKKKLVLVITNWVYEGNNYIGWISLFNTSFPFEELFFWMMFYAASIVSYYELFIDDHTKVLRKRKK